jgi:hypothetical protein
VRAAKLHVFPMRYNVIVKSIHGETKVNSYAIVDCDLLYPDIVNLITLKRIPCIILENSPRDLIVGLPTIIDNNIVQKLEPYYARLSLDYKILYSEMFPLLENVNLNNSTEYSDSAHVQLETCERNYLGDLAGVATLRTLKQPTSPETLKDGYLTTSVDPTIPRGPHEFPRNHPPEHIQYVHKDELLDTQVEPDTIGELHEKDFEDNPVVAIPSDSVPLVK